MAADLIRLSKLMSINKLCSRREADFLIEQGWVMVDNQVVSQLGSKVHPDQTVTLTRQGAQHLAQLNTVLLNKPLGIVSGQAEKKYRPAVALIIPENQLKQDARHHPFQARILKGLAPAGRLDIDSTGLLVLTQDGRIAQKLVGANSNIEKEYEVIVSGIITLQKITILGFGLTMDGRVLKPARITRTGSQSLRFVLKEGRKRQIRRMCQMVGLTVTKLNRVRIGQIRLGTLPVGKWRYLSKDETF